MHPSLGPVLGPDHLPPTSAPFLLPSALPDPELLPENEQFHLLVELHVHLLRYRYLLRRRTHKRQQTQNNNICKATKRPSLLRYDKRRSYKYDTSVRGRASWRTGPFFEQAMHISIWYGAE